MPFTDPIVAGLTLVRRAIRSPDFLAGVSGWSIGRDGSAEFNQATVRGSLAVGSVNDMFVDGPAVFSGSVEFQSPNTIRVGNSLPTPAQDVAPVLGAYHGVANVAISASTNGTAVVNFPAAANFTAPPHVALTISSGAGAAIRATVFAVALSATQMTIRCDLNAAATTTLQVHWFAAPPA